MIFSGKDESQKWLLASAVLNFLLAITKLSWGYYMHSTLVIADGIHSLSDVIGSILIFLALFFAHYKSKRFSYGLFKLEDLAALFAGLAIFAAGYEIVDSIFLHGKIEVPNRLLPTIIFIIILIAVQLVFFFFETQAAKKAGSPGIRADAVNWLGDIGASVVVVIGLVAHHYNFAYAQQAAALIIVLMIAQGGYEVLKESILSLLDTSDVQLQKKIEEIIYNYPDITKIKSLKTRKAGSVYFADIELNMTEKNLKAAHTKIEEISQNLYSKIHELEDVVIQYEPTQKEIFTEIILLNSDKQTLSHRFSQSAYIKIIRKDKDHNKISENLIQNPIDLKGSGKLIHMTAWIIKNDIDKIVLAQTAIDNDIGALFDLLGVELKFVKTC